MNNDTTYQKSSEVKETTELNEAEEPKAPVSLTDEASKTNPASLPKTTSAIGSFFKCHFKKFLCGSLIILILIPLAVFGSKKAFGCTECSGRGTIKCTSCKKGEVDCTECINGLENCPTCNGQMTVYCPTCHGKGLQPCSMCQGSGEVKESRTGRCRTCYGLKEAIINCPQCQGKGYFTEWSSEYLAYTKRTCNRCWGNRTVVGTCTTCHGTGEATYTTTETCSLCDGNGYDQNKTCNHCNGEKAVVCSDCKGNGCTQNTCRTCNGNGTLPCSICNGTAKLKCVSCHGTGKRSKQASTKIEHQ